MTSKDQNKQFLQEISISAGNANKSIENEGFTAMNISENTKNISKKYFEQVQNFISINNIDFKDGLDWRNITQDKIEKGVGKAYGNQLVPGNYVSHIRNQHVPTYSGTCWIWSTIGVYSDTYKIGQVSSGEKNILDAELSRRNLSVQYICDYLGSPDANYRDDMEAEREKLKDKLGSNYRGGSFILCCQVLQDMGICVYENYNPFLSISRDLPSSNSNWYKIKQYDGQSSEINNNYLKNSKKISVCDDNWPSLYPSNGKAVYSSGNVYSDSNPNLVKVFKSLIDFSYDITSGNVSGYRDYTKDKIDISYLRIETADDIEDSENYYKTKSKLMKLCIALFGPIGIGINSHNISFETRNVSGNQYYSYTESNGDVLKWYNGELSDEDFNSKYDNTKSTHAVQIVGWTKANENTGNQCWIVKNSWGELWGDNGYFLVPCGINAYKSEYHPDMMIHNNLLTQTFTEAFNEIKNSII